MTTTASPFDDLPQDIEAVVTATPVSPSATASGPPHVSRKQAAAAALAASIDDIDSDSDSGSDCDDDDESAPQKRRHASTTHSAEPPEEEEDDDEESDSAPPPKAKKSTKATKPRAPPRASRKPKAATKKPRAPRKPKATAKKTRVPRKSKAAAKKPPQAAAAAALPNVASNQPSAKWMTHVLGLVELYCRRPPDQINAEGINFFIQLACMSGLSDDDEHLQLALDEVGFIMANARESVGQTRHVLTTLGNLPKSKTFGSVITRGKPGPNSCTTSTLAALQSHVQAGAERGIACMRELYTSLSMSSTTPKRRRGRASVAQPPPASTNEDEDEDEDEDSDFD